MFNNFPDLFKNKPSVISQATFKNRAQASRDNFIIGLKMYSQNIEANNTHFEKDADPYLRPFDASPRYIKHKAGKGWEDLYLSYESNGSGSTYSKEILLTLFSEDFYNRLNEGEF